MPGTTFKAIYIRGQHMQHTNAEVPSREETRLEALSTKLSALAINVQRLTGNLMVKTDGIFGNEPKDIQSAEAAKESPQQASFYVLESCTHHLEHAIIKLEAEVCRYTESGL
jgi:hypothetical protein